jgi:hypothetical protein
MLMKAACLISVLNLIRNRTSLHKKTKGIFIPVAADAHEKVSD